MVIDGVQGRIGCYCPLTTLVEFGMIVVAVVAGHWVKYDDNMASVVFGNLLLVVAVVHVKTTSDDDLMVVVAQSLAEVVDS